MPIVVPKTVVDLAPTPVSATLSIQHTPSVPYIADPSSPPMHSCHFKSRRKSMPHNSSTLLLTQEPSRQLVPHNKSKGKAKAMEDDEDKEGEATQKLRKELEDFVVPTKFDDKLLILGGRKGDITLVSPATHMLVLEKNGAVAKAFLKWQGKSSQFFVLEGYKGKGKAKALLGDSEQRGAKWSFKSMELVESNSDEEEEEDRVHVIKKIKHEHIEELTGARKRKEIIELEDEEVEIVVPKTPVAGPSCQTSKPMVLVPSVPKPIPKLIVVLASPVAGPSTAPIVPSSVSKPATAAALSKPAPVKSAGPAVKE
ncbi:hypothetical protein C0995_014333, partial [Termitomyces sp. Mi166